MGTIRANCPRCGDVTLVNTDFILFVNSEGPQNATYGFRCPECHEFRCKDASDKVANLLKSHGVKEWVRPNKDSIMSLEKRTSGSPLTYDDLLDLILLLEKEDWFEKLLEFINKNEDKK